jgi:hypothetical protein
MVLYFCLKKAGSSRLSSGAEEDGEVGDRDGTRIARPYRHRLNRQGKDAGLPSHGQRTNRPAAVRATERGLGPRPAEGRRNRRSPSPGSHAWRRQGDGDPVAIAGSPTNQRPDETGTPEAFPSRIHHRIGNQLLDSFLTQHARARHTLRLAQSDPHGKETREHEAPFCSFAAHTLA